MENAWFIFWLSAVSLAFTCGGAVWTINPKLFVRVWRKMAIGDYSIRRPEWETVTVSYSGRLLGSLILCCGLGGFYLLLKILHLVN
jgi:hypothetical protein